MIPSIPSSYFRAPEWRSPLLCRPLFGFRFCAQCFCWHPPTGKKGFIEYFYGGYRPVPFQGSDGAQGAFPALDRFFLQTDNGPYLFVCCLKLFFPDGVFPGKSALVCRDVLFRLFDAFYLPVKIRQQITDFRFLLFFSSTSSRAAFTSKLSSDKMNWYRQAGQGLSLPVYFSGSQWLP